MSFIPNQDCLIYKQNSEVNEFGERTFADPVAERCAFVSFTIATTKTSVRTDSSASEGNAEETTSNVRILFERDSVVARGDKVESLGYTLLVLSVFPRHSIAGVLDHIQVDLETWD